jgi:hypothetical protein
VSVSGARLAVALAAVLLGAAPGAASAQTVQVAPFGGVRFGNDLYEVYTGTSVDLDGAPSFGVTVDAFVREGTSVSFLYSRQEAHLQGVRSPYSTVDFGTLSVEHWHVGGTQELDGGSVRPFLAGTAGLTRFGSRHDSETRFSLAGGAGVKLMPSDHIGARLDGRLYAVFVDGGIGRMVCGFGACLFDLDVLVLWQAEFSAALVVSF